MAMKSNETAIRRPDWMAINARVGSKPQWFLGTNHFDVDVVVVLLLAIPAKSDLTAVGRKRGAVFNARKASERNGRHWQCRRFGGIDRTRRLRPSWRSFLFRFASSLLIVEPSVSEERHPAVSILRGGLELSLFRVLFIPDEAGRERRGAVEFL